MGFFKLFEQEQEWNDLNQKFHEAKKRLTLTRDIEIVQDKKLVREKARLHLGRTTTYQVLLFEQDYSTAQLARIRAQADILRILTQMKLFGGPS
jgi:outer membrane protein TolC